MRKRRVLLAMPMAAWLGGCVTSLSSDRQQPCVATAAVDQDVVLDVQVVPTGSAADPPPAAAPLITGTVFETTPAGRVPVRRALIALDDEVELTR